MTTTADAFNTFYERVRPTSNDLTRAAGRFEQTEATLRRAFTATSSTPLSQVHRIGSVERGTATHPVRDIDLLAVFENKDGIFEKYRHDAQAFLSRVRQQFKGASRVEKVGARGQAVRLFYVDNLWVDVAPAFARQGGGYLLPAGDGTWLSSDPLAQNRWVSDRLKATGDSQRRTVMFAKEWNAAHSRRLGSWHVEVMVLFILTQENNDRRSCLESFFLIGEHNLDVHDPDGLQGDMSLGFTPTQLEAAKQGFDRAYTVAKRAREAERRSDHVEATRLWAEVLGDRFPRI